MYDVRLVLFFSLWPAFFCCWEVNKFSFYVFCSIELPTWCFPVIQIYLISHSNEEWIVNTYNEFSYITMIADIMSILKLPLLAFDVRKHFASKRTRSSAAVSAILF